MAENGDSSGFLAGLVDWRSRRFRFEAIGVLVLALGTVAWSAIPKSVSSTAWGGEVICAWYWGLDWHDEPGLFGRNYFRLTATSADSIEEVVVNYGGSGWHEYCWYRNGRVWETGQMQVSSGRWTRDGMSPPRITRRGLDTRISGNSK